MIIVRFGTTVLLLQMFLLKAFFGLDLPERPKSTVCETDIAESCARALCCTASPFPSNLCLTLFPCYRGIDRI